MPKFGEHMSEDQRRKIGEANKERQRERRQQLLAQSGQASLLEPAEPAAAAPADEIMLPESKEPTASARALQSTADRLGLPRWVGENIHERIVNEAWPKGVMLSCPNCDTTQECPPDQTAKYLAHGWPKCCGVTMQLEAIK